LLTTIYHMLKDGTAFCDLGAAHFDKRPAQVKVNRLVAQLAKLGYEANLRPLEEAA
jgi:transposase